MTLPSPRAPRRRSTSSAGPPALRLSDELAVAVVLALPTVPQRAGDGGPGPDTEPRDSRARQDRTAEHPPVAVLRAEVPAGLTPLDLDHVLVVEQAKAGPGEVVAVPLASSDGPERLLLVGLGAADPAALRKAGSALARRAARSASLVIDLRGVELAEEGVRALAEGLLLASYGYRTPSVASGKDSEPALREVVIVVADPARLQPALAAAVTTCRATAAARDLVNTPSLVKTPQWLATQARTLLAGLDVTVRDEKALRAEGFGGLVGVGMGSSRPPRLIEATWDGTPPGGRAAHVVLVGKGITFDTGGLSLKTNAGMQTMKDDMGGGAAVLATLRAVADLALPLKVTALVAAAENMPSGTAQRPGDVITQYGGRTVEVLNTDAEGRLVLADALAYADTELAPDIVVDVATLTGAMPVALGKRIAGLFATDDALADGLLRAGEASGEAVWRLPLVEDYRIALDSPTADLRNIGHPRHKLQGGAITAALFLREFAGDRPWAHLDIAGPAWSDGQDDELTKGGTGYGVRLLVRWLQDLAAVPVPARAARGRRTSGRRAG